MIYLITSALCEVIVLPLLEVEVDGFMRYRRGLTGLIQTDKKLAYESILFWVTWLYPKATMPPHPH
jgi:hypothetical protein